MKVPGQVHALSKIEHQRLYPRLTDPNFLVLRSRRIIFQNWINTISGNSLKILDVGGRYQPYRRLFGNRVHRYIACDLVGTELVDIIASGESLPFASNTFDVIIATQVFDYFPHPRKAAEEMYDALKPGGILLVSVASIAPRFADQELWRFTRGGIGSTFSQFRTLEIVAESSSLGGLFRTINILLYSFTYQSFLKKLYEVTICPCLNLAGWALESANLTKNEQFAPNYSVFAVK
jgi:SAM-dependent methyltransferase